MYEHITFETILQRMLDRVPNTIDKRESSIIYDALAPAAIECQLMYIEFDTILKETFGDTASRDFLILRAKERGIKPTEATYAIVKGEFNIDVPIGSRFSCGDLNYFAKEKIRQNEYKMQCETVGVIGNKNFGNLIPIDYIDSLELAKLTELLIPGEDEEDTETFRKRYFDSFESKAYGGNVDDYLNKTNAIAGVGSTKVTPVWNGGGTVKLTILNSEFNKASSELIQTVQNKMDPTQDGQGIGIAPVGHIVTVDTTEEVVINISTTITFDEGYSFDNKKYEIEQIVSDYLLEIRKEWATQTNSVIRVAQIESKIMGIQGIIDITGTKINGSNTNLTLSKYQIPVMGGVTNG